MHVCIYTDSTMQPQQQQATAVTTDPAVQPMYVVQPYNQTANTVSSYKHVQSTIVGIALISTGYLTILFNIVELVVVSAAIGSGHLYRQLRMLRYNGQYPIPF